MTTIKAGDSGLTVSTEALRQAYREAINDVEAAWRSISAKQGEIDEEMRAVYGIEARAAALADRIAARAEQAQGSAEESEA